MTSFTWAGHAVGVNRRLMPGRGGRWFANPEYKAFKASLVAAMQIKHDVFMLPVQVRIHAILNPRMDTDSILKPVLDALEEAGVVENDRLVVCLLVTRERRAPHADDIIQVQVESYQCDSWTQKTALHEADTAGTGTFPVSGK